MERIVAGRFQTKDRADAVAAMMSPRVATADICIFHNNPQGQHDVGHEGGADDEEPGADGAGKSAAGMAVAGGLAAGAIGAVAGPIGALAAAGTGAYLGSLAGAMERLGDTDDAPKVPELRPGGVILSVRTIDADNEAWVIGVLRANGAVGIEQALGEWKDGDWTNFDPTAVPRLVGGTSSV